MSWWINSLTGKLLRNFKHWNDVIILWKMVRRDKTCNGRIWDSPLHKKYKGTDWIEVVSVLMEMIEQIQDGGTRWTKWWDPIPRGVRSGGTIPEMRQIWRETGLGKKLTTYLPPEPLRMLGCHSQVLPKFLSLPCSSKLTECQPDDQNWTWSSSSPIVFTF